MNCENEFCIYQKDKKCLLDRISIGESGCCEECLYIHLPTEALENLKEKSRKKYEEYSLNN